tara:strand:+ start:161 stop:430 length:270 start_codon:yes stop_codon:yes gene_type:complete
MTGSTWNTYSEISTLLQPGESIDSVSCIGVNTSDTDISGTGSILITSGDIRLGGECNGVTHNVLEIVAGFNGSTKTITINTLSGLAEVQ